MMQANGPANRAFLKTLVLLIFLLSCATLSVDEEKRLGESARRAVAEQFQFVRDPSVTAFVEGLRRRLASASEPSAFRFDFTVVDDPNINAFALPAGAIYVHSGTIRAARDPAQLAGVLAHEMAHVTRRHVAHLYQRSRNTGLAAAVASVFAAVLTDSPAVAQAGSAAAELAATAYLGTFTREAEREADRVAIATLVRAGIDPHAMVEFFELLAREQAGRAQPPPFLSSHPTTRERITAARAEIARQRVTTPLSRGDLPAFRRIQARLPERAISRDAS